MRSRPYAAGEPQPHRLEGVGKHEALLIGHLQIHRRVAEVAESVQTVRSSGSRSSRTTVRCVGLGTRRYRSLRTVRRVCGPGDLAFQLITPEPRAANTTSVELVRDGPGRSCRVPYDADVGVDTPDRLRFQIHLATHASGENRRPWRTVQ